MNLSSLASLLIETFLPEAHQKYLCMNYMQTGQYRKYKSFVPGYLQDRPRSTIIHCLERKSKALKYSGEDITTVGDQKGTFEVRGSSSKTHKVDFGLHTQMPSCTCADWTQWHIPCKHFFAVFRLVPTWDWYKLPTQYLEGPYLSTDQQSLDSFFGSTQSGGSLDEQDDTVHNDIQTLSEIPQTKVCQACLNFTMFMHMLCPSHAFLSGNNVSYTFSTDLHCITQTGGCTC